MVGNQRCTGIALQLIADARERIRIGGGKEMVKGEKKETQAQAHAHAHFSCFFILLDQGRGE